MRDRWYPGLSLIAALIGCTPNAYAQGPIGGFPVAKGEVAFAPGFSREVYHTYYGENGSPEAREVTTTSYNFFLEAGMNDLTTLVATLPYLETNERSGSLQDASLWIKYKNLDSRSGNAAHRVFTAVGLSFPISNYETMGIAAIGQRATVFQTRLVYQYQFDNGFFVHGQSGMDIQFAPESRTSWPVLLRTGYGSRLFYAEGWLEFVTALNGGTAVQTATASTGSSWQRAGGTLYLPIQPWVGLNIGGAYVFGGEYIGQSLRYNLGLVFKVIPD